LTTQVFRL